MISGGVFSSLLEDLRAHDSAWAPALQAISAGDARGLVSALIDPGTGVLRQELAKHVTFGVPDDSDENDEASIDARNTFSDAKGSRSDPIGERISVAYYCFLCGQVEMARTLFYVPLPPEFAGLDRAQWSRLLSSFLREGGQVVQQQLPWVIAQDEVPGDVAFLELLLEVDPQNPSFARTSLANAAAAARIAEAAMQLRIRQTEARTPAAPAATAAKRTRVL